MKTIFLTGCLVAAITIIPYAAQAQDRDVPQTKSQINLSFAPVVRQVAPAVVNVYTKTIVTRSVSPFMDDPFFQQFFGNNFGLAVPGEGGLTRKQVEGALGSGVIVSPDGLIVTNAHVVKGSDKISVALNDQREFDAKIVLIDTSSDLALLRIDTKGEKLPTVRLEATDHLEVGDLVLAIGDPFGVGQTVTSGIVSALARSALDVNNYNFFIQTDAAINPGNSGGPLVAMDGGVVGINSAIYSRSGGSLGIGFAIPSEMVQSVIAAEKSRKDESRPITHVPRPWLGVTSQRVSADMADTLGMKIPEGTMVTRLQDTSPLARAGVKVGDVLVSMDGKPIHDGGEMKFRMATVPIGQTADIGVFRNGKTFTVKVLAALPPEDPPRDQTTLDQGLFDGATVSNINPAVIGEMDALKPSDTGVVVVSVRPGSTAERFLQPGDIPLKVNGRKIENVSSLRRAASMKGDGFSLVLSRGGQIQQIVVR